MVKIQSRKKMGLFTLIKKNRKAQILGMDVVVAFVIFSFGLIIFFLFMINSQTDSIGVLEPLFYDGELIAESILSDGSPGNWDVDNVVKIGILSESKINNTKLKSFYDFTQADYIGTKILFNTKYDYFVLFNESIMIDGEMVQGVGKPGINPENIDTNNLIKINRITVHEDKLVNLYIYIWN